MPSEEAMKTVFYVIIMIIVVYIGVAIVTGLNPVAFYRQQQLSQLFEPGKIYVNERELEKITEFGCLGAVKILALDGVKFDGKRGQGNKLEFIIVLDYDNLLFVGRYGDEQKKITCSLPEGSENFQCRQDLKLEFKLKGATPTGRRTFHFTIWDAKQTVLETALDAEEHRTTSLSGMLENYGSSYISSFDVTVDVDAKCKETECGRIDNENDCKDKNNEGCYYGGWPWSRGCKLCPSSTNCNDYDGEQCVQCPIPRANCQPGTLYGCEAR